MDEALNEIMARMNKRNLERIHSDCERDGDFELAEILATRIEAAAGEAEAPAISS